MRVICLRGAGPAEIQYFLITFEIRSPEEFISSPSNNRRTSGRRGRTGEGRAQFIIIAGHNFLGTSQRPT